MALIEINGVEYVYKDSGELALDDIDLTVNQGEYISIIGANGSGKSTLAKLMNGLLKPSKGEVLVEGLRTTNPENIWDIRQKIGMVFQNPDNQLVATKVEDDVAFGLENLGVPTPKIRKQVDEALKMVGMDDYQDHTPHKLSGGQKQRVAIAGIIAMEPSCIILDEPTAMLDPGGRKEVMDTIEYLNKEKNITIIHITHFMEEAVQSEKVLVMNQGKIVKSANPYKIFRDAQFLKKINLDVPIVAELASVLRNSNIDIPEVLFIDELVDALC